MKEKSGKMWEKEMGIEDGEHREKYIDDIRHGERTERLRELKYTNFSTLSCY